MEDLGESADHPSEEPEDNKPSKASGGVSEVCGRTSNEVGTPQERAGMAQGKRNQGPAERKKGPANKPRARKRKEAEGTPGERFRNLKQMFEDMKKQKNGR